MPIMLLLLASPIGAFAFESCHTRDANCPACEHSNVTIDTNFTHNFCTALPNPLVLHNGTCCPMHACEEFQCPMQCESDAGASFARALGQAAPPATLDYDCSRTEAARQCAKNLDKEGADCACLARECYAAAKLLQTQPADCVTECSQPKAVASICPNYDDENTFCEFHAVFLCVGTAKACDASTLMPSPCQHTCMDKSKAAKGDASDKLDTFLQCLGTCSAGSDRETQAARLEAVVEER